MDTNKNRRPAPVEAAAPAGGGGTIGMDGGGGDVDDTNAAHEVENTRAKRISRSQLEAALANKKCRNCGQTGCWVIYKTIGRVRYVRCEGCQFNDELVPAGVEAKG